MMPAPYSADLRWRVIWFVMLSRGQLAFRFCNHLSLKVIIPEKCALTILELN